MSSQPSAADQVKEQAKAISDSIANTMASESSRTDTTAGTKNITKDDQGQIIPKGGFQDQLNKLARGESLEEESILSKVASMVPGFSRSTDSDSTEASKTESAGDDGTSTTHHDHQVEEFLRKQYMSLKMTFEKIEGKDRPNT